MTMFYMLHLLRSDGVYAHTIEAIFPSRKAADEYAKRLEYGKWSTVPVMLIDMELIEGMYPKQ